MCRDFLEEGDVDSVSVRGASVGREAAEGGRRARIGIYAERRVRLVGVPAHGSRRVVRERASPREGIVSRTRPLSLL